MILGPFMSKPLSDVSLSLMSQYSWEILGVCLHVAEHPLCVSL